MFIPPPDVMTGGPYRFRTGPAVATGFPPYGLGGCPTRTEWRPYGAAGSVWSCLRTVVEPVRNGLGTDFVSTGWSGGPYIQPVQASQWPVAVAVETLSLSTRS